MASNLSDKNQCLDIILSPLNLIDPTQYITTRFAKSIVLQYQCYVIQSSTYQLQTLANLIRSQQEVL